MCRGKAYHGKWGHHPRHHYARKARKHWQEQYRARWNVPPVNVKELDDRFELHVFAAGYEKNDFQVQVSDHILRIKVQKQESEIVESPNWRRQEFKADGFERRFELNEKVDKEAITAEYKDGILKVTLPKLAGFETNRQDIIVA